MAKTKIAEIGQLILRGEPLEFASSLHKNSEILPHKIQTNLF